MSGGDTGRFCVVKIAYLALKKVFFIPFFEKQKFCFYSLSMAYVRAQKRFFSKNVALFFDADNCSPYAIRPVYQAVKERGTIQSIKLFGNSATLKSSNWRYITKYQQIEVWETDKMGMASSIKSNTDIILGIEATKLCLEEDLDYIGNFYSFFFIF